MIYVDTMMREAKVEGMRYPAKWSHMFADSPQELLEAGIAIGLDPRWLQHPGTHQEHFDVAKTMRNKAIQLGALEILYPHETATLMMRRRKDVCECQYIRYCHWGAIVTARDANRESV